MDPERQVHRNGGVSWRFRFTDPRTGRRSHKTICIRDRRSAEAAFAAHLESLCSERLGRGCQGFDITYAELTNIFLREAPITSEQRRREIARHLAINPLGLRYGSELNVRHLNARMRRLSRSPVWLYRAVQQPLKQMTRYCLDVGLLPYDPLAGWRRLPRDVEPPRRRAFTPELMRRVLDATEILDKIYRRSHPMSLVVQVLLASGNRPNALFAARVRDMHWDRCRIKLRPGAPHKRNGASYLPAALMAELHVYVGARGAAGDDPLLAAPDGGRLDVRNISRAVTRAILFALIRQAWPEGEIADVLDVEYILSQGRRRGLDGRPPRDGGKRAGRRAHVERIDGIAERLRPEVERRMVGLCLYSLRATHITWARRLVNHDSVRLQVGHAGRDVEERHYLDLDLVDARESTEAVWDVLQGRVDLATRCRADTGPKTGPKKEMGVNENVLAIS